MARGGVDGGARVGSTTGRGDPSSGVAAARLLAGLQIATGYFSVAAVSLKKTATDLSAPGDTSAIPCDERAPVGATPEVTFVVHLPGRSGNEGRVVFRGRRDEGTGGLVGELVPDFTLRSVGLMPLGVTIGAITALVALVLLPLVTGGRPEGLALFWSVAALAGAIAAARSFGAAVHEAARNVERDSPGARVTWHSGIRVSSVVAAPPPPPATWSPEVPAPGVATVPTPTSGVATVPTPTSGLGAPTGRVVTDDAQRARYRRVAWLSLLGLVVPIAIVSWLILPVVRARSERSDWVRIDGVAGAAVDQDHRQVTYVLPDGSERTSTVPVLRSVEDGDTIDLQYPPGRPDLMEQDDRGLALPAFLIGIGLVTTLMTVSILVRFVVALRRSRRPSAT